ncbi:hypothetical protein IW140_003628 [Coemansia sp. RSA 1813]|nr:hypothetical protein IW140_003628 [Coemansia sp. RSA 1813]
MDEPVDRRQSRKSLGRRVSFAPTAHVRMFEAADEKQANAQKANRYVMPDLSSQTGMVGFDLGTLTTIDDTSMNSNESFDVSVRNSELSDSVYSSEGSFAMNESGSFAGTNSANADTLIKEISPAGLPTSSQSQNYANVLDNGDDDDDSLDEDDGDDDAVTMELTGTVDMGAIENDDSDNERDATNSSNIAADSGVNARAGSHETFNQTTSLSDLVAGGTPLVSGPNTEQILNALLQGSNTNQDTSLLDNIIFQFQSSQQQQQQQTEESGGNGQNTMDLDFTRVEPSADADDIYDMDTTIQPNVSELVHTLSSTDGQHASADAAAHPDYEMDDESSDDGNNNEDAVTMELTGVVSSESLAMDTDSNAFDAQTQDTDQTKGATSAGNFGLFDLLQLPASLSLQQQQQLPIPGAASTPKTPRAVIQRTPGRIPSSQVAGNGVLGTPVDISSVFYSAGTAEALSALFSHASPKNMAQSVNLQSQALSPAAKAVLQIANMAASPRAVAPAAMTTPRKQPSTPRAPGTFQRTPGSRNNGISRTPVQRVASARGTPLPFRLPDASHTPAKAQSPSINSANPFYTGNNSSINNTPETSSVSVFELDPLPRIPLTTHSLPQPNTPGSSLLAEQAKAGLVFDIHNAYRYQNLVPQTASDSAELLTIDAKFEPLYRKAKLTARLEYCSSLVSLFEADQDISRLSEMATTDFGHKVAFFSESNDALLQRKEELLLRIAKTKSRLAEEAPTDSTGKLSGEIKELREKLFAIKHEREETSTKTEQLSSDIQALQTTNSSFDRQVTEKKSAQKLLLAINGLQLADLSENSCEFVYDRFSKLHLDNAAEFTSLHPDINWNAIVRDTVNKDDMTLRQYSIAIMKLNATLNELLDDVKRVKRHTFVEVSCSDGIQVRMQLFSKQMRRRFYLQVPLKSVESYKALRSETDFDWPAEIVYGSVDQEKLKLCLMTCDIDDASPLLSIYQHLESCMESY